MRIQFPVTDNDGVTLVLKQEYRTDDCLTFYSDGTIRSNGGAVSHHEVTEESIALLSLYNQERVRKFLSGNYHEGRSHDNE